MMMSWSGRWRRWLLLAVAVPGVCMAQPGGAKSQVSLVSEFEGVVPGETSMLALRFDVPEEWHIYQPSQNDTGLEPMVEWSSDADLRIGEFVWPAGKRFVQPGEILDHGYEGTVLLMVPVDVPAALAVGSEVTVSASVEWLECDAELCVPGSADVSITLPVRESASLSEYAEQFDTARAGLGVQLRGDPSEPVDVSWDGQTLVVAQKTRDGVGLSFVPGAGSARVRDLHAAGASDTGELRLEFQDIEGDVVGWIRVKHADGGSPSASSVWSLRTPVGGGS